MFNRIQIKNRAKQTLSKTYWQSLAVAVIISLISGIAGGFFSLRITNAIVAANTALQVGIIGLVTLLQAGISFAVSIFFITPLSLGMNKFMLDAAKSGFTDIGAIGYSFRSNYKNIVKVTFIKALIPALFSILPFVLAFGALIALGVNPLIATTPKNIAAQTANLPTSQILISLGMVLAAYVLFIPSLMKTFDYFMVEYILAEDADISWREALKKSKQMMRGNRFATFVMQLSFIGWALLGVMLCGIGAIFVEPYINAANAHLYLELSGHSVIKTDSESTEFDG